MKKYIILAYSIGGVGGGQLYSRSKKKYLEELGWEVRIFSHTEGDIFVDDLKSSKGNIIPELKYPPFFYTNSQKEKIINRFTYDRNYEEVIIESHSVNLSLWGELIAQKIGGKHFIYLTSEVFGKLNPSKYKFLEFKHQRKELAGIQEKSLDLLFKGYKILKPEEKYFFYALSFIDVVEDIENKAIDHIHKRDINIGCITRLGKLFVLPLIEGIIEFAKSNPDKKIQLVLIGGTYYQEREELIRSKVKNIDNLEVYITGYLHPIPRKLFKVIDFFIGVAGGAFIPAMEGVMTLAVDCKSAKPIGIVGYETLNVYYAEEGYSASLKDRLNEILIKKELPENKEQKHTLLLTREFFKDYRKKELMKFMSFIQQSENNRQYYQVKNIKPTFKEILTWLVVVSHLYDVKRKVWELRAKPKQ